MMAPGSARTLFDLLFPPRCVVCGSPGSAVCGACLGKARQAPEPRCVRCDAPLDARMSRAGQCAECASGRLAPALDRMLVATLYEGVIQTAIQALKYHGKRRAAAPLAALMADRWRAAGGQADVIIPIALHASRLHERGYNQADLLGRELARRTGLSLRRDLLTRARATRPQTHTAWEERERNVAGAFALRPGAQATLANRVVLLVDDVMTTGATAQAAASALRTAHPAAIIALAIARPAPGSGDGASRGW